MRIFIGSLIVLVIALTISVVILVVQESNDCKAKDGEMVGTGNYATTYVMSGKVLVPVTNEVYECSK